MKIRELLFVLDLSMCCRLERRIKQHPKDGGSIPPLPTFGDLV